MSNSNCSLTNTPPSPGTMIHSVEDLVRLTTVASSYSPSDPTAPTNNTLEPARPPTSEPEVDICGSDSDSDSDTSWVDVPMAESEPMGNTQSRDAVGATSTAQCEPARTCAKRRSSSFDESEWEFC